MDWFLFPIKLHPVDSGIGRGLGMLLTVSPKDLGVCGRTVWHTGPALSQQDDTGAGGIYTSVGQAPPLSHPRQTALCVPGGAHSPLPGEWTRSLLKPPVPSCPPERSACSLVHTAHPPSTGNPKLTPLRKVPATWPRVLLFVWFLVFGFNQEWMLIFVKRFF